MYLMALLSLFTLTSYVCGPMMVPHGSTTVPGPTVPIHPGPIVALLSPLWPYCPYSP